MENSIDFLSGGCFNKSSTTRKVISVPAIPKSELMKILRRAKSLQTRHGIAASFDKKGLIPVVAVALTAIPKGKVQALAEHVAKPSGAPALHSSWVSGEWDRLWDGRQDSVSAALREYLGDDDDLIPGKKGHGIQNALTRLEKLP